MNDFSSRPMPKNKSNIFAPFNRRWRVYRELLTNVQRHKVKRIITIFLFSVYTPPSLVSAYYNLWITRRLSMDDENLFPIVFSAFSGFCVSFSIISAHTRPAQLDESRDDESRSNHINPGWRWFLFLFCKYLRSETHFNGCQMKYENF